MLQTIKTKKKVWNNFKKNWSTIDLWEFCFIQTHKYIVGSFHYSMSFSKFFLVLYLYNKINNNNEYKITIKLFQNVFSV